MTTTPDASGNGYTGTLVTFVPGSLPVLVTSPWAGFDTAMRFSGANTGTNQGVDCGAWAAGGPPLPSGPFTIEARIKKNPDRDVGNIAGWFQTDQPPQLYLGGPAYYAYVNTLFLSGGSVSSVGDVVAMDWDGTTLRLYVNGAMVDSAPAALSDIVPASPDPTDAFYIGTDQAGEDLDGIIDEVRYSSIARYASDGGYTPAASPFSPDAHTVCLYHLDPSGPSGPPMSPTATVASVNPCAGSTAGGASVVIRGEGLASVTAVTFGSTPAASFAVIDDTTILAVSPPETARTVNVTVST